VLISGTLHFLRLTRRILGRFRASTSTSTRGGVHNSGFSVALGRSSLRIAVPRVARDTAWPAVQRDLWTSIRGLCVTYLTDHNYILLLEIPAQVPPSFLPPPSASYRIVRSFPRRYRASIRDDILQDFLIYRS